MQPVQQVAHKLMGILLLIATERQWRIVQCLQVVITGGSGGRTLIKRLQCECLWDHTELAAICPLYSTRRNRAVKIWPQADTLYTVNQLQAACIMPMTNSSIQKPKTDDAQWDSLSPPPPQMITGVSNHFADISPGSIWFTYILYSWWLLISNHSTWLSKWQCVCLMIGYRFSGDNRMNTFRRQMSSHDHLNNQELREFRLFHTFQLMRCVNGKSESTNVPRLLTTVLDQKLTSVACGMVEQ